MQADALGIPRDGVATLYPRRAKPEEMQADGSLMRMVANLRQRCQRPSTLLGQ
jgi:hypothetical protein